MEPSSILRMDEAFDRIATLRDGNPVRLRWIRPSDATLLREGFARLSKESRYMRFFASIRELPDDAVRYLTEVDGYNHAALFALSIPHPFSGEPERGVGVARFVRSAKNLGAAEVAVTVADDLQRRGLGLLLVETLAAAARERGVDTFTANVLSENVRARNMLIGLGANWIGRDGDVSLCSLRTARLAERASERWRFAA